MLKFSVCFFMVRFKLNMFQELHIDNDLGHVLSIRIYGIFLFESFYFLLSPVGITLKICHYCCTLFRFPAPNHRKVLICGLHLSTCHLPMSLVMKSQAVSNLCEYLCLYPKNKVFNQDSYMIKYLFLKDHICASIEDQLEGESVEAGT